MYVYAIGSETGLVKIGKAPSPSKRLEDLQMHSLVALSLLGKIKCPSDDDAVQKGFALYRKWQGKHVSGGWFDLTPDELREDFPESPLEFPQAEPYQLAEFASSPNP